MTGDERFRALAEGASVTLTRQRWHSAFVQCHGLAGHGDALVDLAQLTGDPVHLGRARTLPAVIHTRHMLRDGLMVAPDESGREADVSFNIGLSGVVGFLLRLRDGGHRWWLPDEVLHLPTPGAGPRTGPDDLGGR